MIPEIQSIQDSLFGTVGNLALVGLGIMAFFIVIFMIFNIDFRFALMIDAVLIPAFVEMGWFPLWVLGVGWVLIVGIGLFMLWILIKER